MPNAIISDTSCFIILANIGELDLLRKVYGEIITTKEIALEYGDILPEWVEIVVVKDKGKQQLLELQLDKGESSAIALSLEMPNSTLIIDDYKARKIAERLSLTYTGTMGVIIKAKLLQVIPSIRPLLEKIKQTNFYISKEIEQQALKEANELMPPLV